MKRDSSSKFPVVPCLVCTKPIEFPEYIITGKKYKGEVRCQECTSILHIKTSEFNIEEYKRVEEYKIVTDKSREAAAKKSMDRMQAALAKEKD